MEVGPHNPSGVRLHLWLHLFRDFDHRDREGLLGGGPDLDRADRQSSGEQRGHRNRFESALSLKSAEEHLIKWTQTAMIG